VSQLDLTGRTAIITGASRGIGLAAAQAIAAAGGNVVLTSRPQKSADAAAEAVLHGSSPATAQIFGATGGYLCRYAIVHTEGATFGPFPTVEDIARNRDRIRDCSIPNELVAKR
jgi:NAD(P)-dependent dehydrogenase (short-subunit alcohol dehydrogenase family)